MKTILLVIVCSFMIMKANYSYSQQKKNSTSEMTYVIMINSLEEEKRAEILINSIRAYGGNYSSMPVILVVSDSTQTQGSSLKGKVQEIITLKMNERFRQFPFSDKVYACAQVEEMVAGKTNWLVWINPDALMVAPPTAITANSNAWAALRPVHIQNIGDIAGAPISDYWKKIYEVAGLDTNKIWSVESYVDNKKLNGYFNSGCMAFNPSKGIFRTWKNDYEKLLLDSVNYAYYTSNPSYSFFCHQAVLSAVVMAKIDKEKINMLPPSFGYPLHLQQQENFNNKIRYFSEMVIVLEQNYLKANQIDIQEPFRSWIDANVK